MPSTSRFETLASAPTHARARPHATLGLLLELGKARLSTLVLLTTAVGFLLASGRTLDWSRLAWTLAGTGLAALGANTLNQWLEADRDARMQRTASRPLPTGRMSPPAALTFGLIAGGVGPLLLVTAVNTLAALLSLSAVLVYVLLYTPLKTRTAGNTLVGAVVGALPPMIGWAAAAGRLDGGAWILAAILFVWQIPHSLTLAWLCREDYARGGLRMLPVVDAGGHLTGCVIVVYTLVLLPLTLMLTFIGAAGWAYASGALLGGLGLLASGVALERSRSVTAARRLFRASIVYLLLLLGLMVLDRTTAARPQLAATPSSAALEAPVGSA